MLILREAPAAERLADPAIRNIVQARFSAMDAENPDLDEWGYFIVIEDGDVDADVEKQLGFSVFANRFNGKVFGDAGFTPSFEILEDHESCVELVFVLSDDGYGVEVLIPHAVSFDSRLRSLCERYAIRPQESSR